MISPDMLRTAVCILLSYAGSLGMSNVSPAEAKLIASITVSERPTIGAAPSYMFLAVPSIVSCTKPKGPGLGS